MRARRAPGGLCRARRSARFTGGLHAALAVGALSACVAATAARPATVRNGRPRRVAQASPQRQSTRVGEYTLTYGRIQGVGKQMRITGGGDLASQDMVVRARTIDLTWAMLWRQIDTLHATGSVTMRLRLHGPASAGQAGGPRYATLTGAALDYNRAQDLASLTGGVHLAGTGQDGSHVDATAERATLNPTTEESTLAGKVAIEMRSADGGVATLTAPTASYNFRTGAYDIQQSGGQPAQTHVRIPPKTRASPG